MQEQASECVGQNLNLYLDSVQQMGKQYGACKNDCLAANPRLVKELKDMNDETVKGQRTRYFDPLLTDPCVTECRGQFYFVLKRTTSYFVEDSGFLIENAINHKLWNYKNGGESGWKIAGLRIFVNIVVIFDSTGFDWVGAVSSLLDDNNWFKQRAKRIAEGEFSKRLF